MRYIAKHTGSLEHPWHFWLGYLLPLAHQIRMRGKFRGKPRVIVRECGPMTPWLEALGDACSLQIVKPGVLLNDFAHGKRFVILDEWDDWNRFGRRQFGAAVEALREILGVSSSSSSVGEDRLKITLLDRRAAVPFYDSQESEAKGAGASRRSITNISEVAERLKTLGEVQVVDTSQKAPLDATAVYSDCDVLVGQWGAGLTNMLWMRPGATVVELRSPTGTSKCYQLLASALNLNFISVEALAGDHGDADVRRVVASIGDGAYSPISPGPAKGNRAQGLGISGVLLRWKR